MDIDTYLKTTGRQQSELARALSVDPPLLYQWRKRIRKVPAERCWQIERATDGAVTCEELRPDLAEHWAYLRGTAAATRPDREHAA